ncbi:hypothetical protein R6Q57_009435 [Mikania cordata]
MEAIKNVTFPGGHFDGCGWEINNSFSVNSKQICDHLFSSCFLSSLLWQGISSWCKIDPIYAFFVKDLLEVHRFINGSWNKRESIHAIMLTAIWCIWMSRNEIMFNRRRKTYHAQLREVKDLSYLWVKNRAKWVSVS